MRKLFVQIGDSQEELFAVALVPGLNEVKRIPLYAAIGEYVAVYTANKKSKYTRNNEKTYFTTLYEFLFSKNIFYCDEVTKNVLLQYRNQLLKKVIAATANRQFNTIKNFFNMLYRNEAISKNPGEFIKHEKETAPKVHLWTGRDFIRAKNGLSPAVQDILYFFWYSGARPCEAVNLTWSDVDHEAQTIILRSDKNSKVTRTITLTRRISKLFHTMELKGHHVFGRGSMFTSDSLGKMIRKSVLKNCQNKEITAKGIRHTYCTRAIEKGINNKTVQEMLGHASWRTTEKYSHLSRKYLNQCSEKM